MDESEMNAKKNVDVDKEIVKEAIEEWLDKQFAKFGKWSLTGITCALAVWAFYGWLTSQGWRK